MALDSVQLLAPVRDRPGAAGICADFDGTLAPIVDQPSAARPLEGTYEVLDELAKRFALVAVLSGRPAAFVEPFVPPSVVVSGLYGLELVRAGRRAHHPTAGVWREAIDDVTAASVAAGPGGMLVEAKGLSLTLHYRGRPELADEVEAWARRQAARAGLEVRPARMSIELHPPVNADKGTALRALVDDLSSVLYAGDDVGDLPAFAALDELDMAGVSTVRVAVRSDESPPELLSAADLVVDGPAGVLALLQSLSRQ
ncbi:MAG: trehalose-phosphatase [Acidimicrobiales bacterium]